MSSFIEAFGHRRLGFAFHVIAAICGISAAYLTWTATERWLGIYALDKAQVAALAGDFRAMHDAAKDASDYLPDLAAPGLLAIDWSDPHATPAIERLINRLPNQQRPFVETMQALHHAMHQLPNSPSLSGSDEQLLKSIHKTRQGLPTAPLEFVSSDPPSAPIWGFVVQQQFIAAWTEANRNAIRKTAGNLRLAMPSHPEQRYVTFINNALTPDIKNNVLVEQAKPLSSDVGALAFTRILRQLVTLVPERSALFLPLIPPDIRTPAENAALLGSDKTLEHLVTSALKSGTLLRTVVALIERSLTEQRYDLAKQLAASLKEPERATWTRAVAQAAGDLTTLQQLTLDAGYIPTAYGLQHQGNHLRFHLISPAGIAPSAAVLVRIGTEVIADERIQRLGSLVNITLGEQRGPVVITCDKFTIYSGTIP